MKKFLLAFSAVATITSGMSVSAASADSFRRHGGGGYNGGYGGHHGGYFGGYRGHRGGYYRGGGYRHHRGGGDALAAGAIGLGVGAILGSTLSRPTYGSYYGNGYYGDGTGYYGSGYYSRPAAVVLEGPVYRERATRYYRPVRGYDHVSACAARYRTYEARSDTFIGYDGNAHRCRL